jgi:heme/copper-type cytochrome/quinol oxidase subunit 3
MANVVELRPEIAARQRASELTSSIGMMIALGSFTMLFGALFFVYAGLRAQSLGWPPEGSSPLPLGLPSASTAAIVASSATLVKALGDLRRGRHRASIAWMAATLALGAAFLGLQAWLWLSLWNSGVTAGSGMLGTVVWGLTVLHALHLFAGLAVLVYLLAAALQGRQAGADDMHRRMVSLRLCGMFWHFVDAVWVLMFVAIFLT